METSTFSFLDLLFIPKPLLSFITLYAISFFSLTMIVHLQLFTHLRLFISSSSSTFFLHQCSTCSNVFLLIFHIHVFLLQSLFKFLMCFSAIILPFNTDSLVVHINTQHSSWKFNLSPLIIYACTKEDIHTLTR